MENISYEAFWHSTSHIMAYAVKILFPEAKLGIGPAIDVGFYYDFDTSPFTPDDLTSIEEKMKEIISENYKFEKREVKKEEGKKIFEKLNEIYKLELLDKIEGDIVSLYQSGDFIDLCKGPHITSTGEVKYFKLLSIAGAYWLGSEKNKMLQRLYGISFRTKDDLQNYLKGLEEAEKRDHRKLGKELELFSIEEEVGSGLILWHPKGAIIRKTIEDFWEDEHIKRNYQIVYTPHLAKNILWNTSGHLSFYKENMFSGMDIEGIEYLVKPMNCPYHILIYKSKIRSYRELPFRLCELGTVYRYEKSGVLHGLLRVRGFTQDDAHIFCTPAQLKDEILTCVDFVDFMMSTFGFHSYEVYLATRPEKYSGTEKIWDTAENTLREALKEKNVNFKIDGGGAVFYGPKIDIKIKDALGRLWQGPTVQFDFNLPEKFNVTYVGEDGKHHFVYMVHRALLGSLERFFGTLIEHYGGAFPLWLSPLQVTILPIAAKHIAPCEKIKETLLTHNIRVHLDERNEKISAKIRDAQLQKVPYMIIVGDKEIESDTISLRERKEGDIGKFTLQEFIEKIGHQIKNRL